MAADLQGKVAVYGIDGTIAFTGLVKTVNIVKGFSFTQNAREARLEQNGHIIGGARDLSVRRISVTFCPFDSTAAGTPGSTLAVAKDNLQASIPPELGDLTIADWDVTIFDGTWTAVGAISITTNEAGYAEVTVEGEQYRQANGTYAALSALG
jgi:hypothetical protein